MIHISITKHPFKIAQKIFGKSNLLILFFFFTFFVVENKNFCRYEGVLGFYKGLKPNLTRVVPASCITFVVYENVSHYMLRQKEIGIKK